VNGYPSPSGCALLAPTPCASVTACNVYVAQCITGIQVHTKYTNIHKHIFSEPARARGPRLPRPPHICPRRPRGTCATRPPPPPWPPPQPSRGHAGAPLRPSHEPHQQRPHGWPKQGPWEKETAYMYVCRYVCIYICIYTYIYSFGPRTSLAGSGRVRGLKKKDNGELETAYTTHIYIGLTRQWVSEREYM